MNGGRPGCVEMGCVFVGLVIAVVIVAVLVATLDRAGELILDFIDSVEVNIK